LYREVGLEALLKSGTITPDIEFDRPAMPQANQSPGTRSQILAYRDRAGVVVLRVHRYLRPDGTLGASGRPDPKYIFHDGVIYKEGAPPPR
jgi:hypothetical protein